MNKTVFIIDTYDAFSSYNDTVRYIFQMNGRPWCIKEVTCNWGKPNIGISFEECPPQPEDFYLYNTYEEALNYVEKLKKINRGI